MPKLKTNKSAAKRFKRTASGYKHRSSFRNHILTKKAKKRKSQLRPNSMVVKSDVESVARMMCDKT